MEKPRGIGRAGKALLLGAVLAAGAAARDRTVPFLLGADISWLPQREAEGRAYHVRGVRQDALLILKAHGFNAIRLRIFHDPRAAGGYSAAGHCGLASTLAMARRVKAAGMALLLDFHYSDTWADPAHQRKPAAWAGLAFPDLVEALGAYTGEVLGALHAQGTLPDMVQVGNEINPGILLPDGASSDWDGLSSLLGAGIAAVRKVDPGVEVMLHLASGGDNAACRWFMDRALAAGLAFDVLGLSCYTRWHGPPDAWEANLRDLAERYPRHAFVIAEYSQEKRRANDIAFNLPGGRGLGAFIWEPLEFEEALFDDRGGGRWEANDRLEVYPELARKYGLAPGPAFLGRTGRLPRMQRGAPVLEVLPGGRGVRFTPDPEGGVTWRIPRDGLGRIPRAGLPPRLP